jgi:hypothetical protein
MLTASTVYIYAGGQLKPPTSTDISPGGLLSQPPAHLSEYLRSERGLTQPITHSLTRSLLAPNPSRCRKQPRAPPQTTLPHQRHSWVSPTHRRLSTANSSASSTRAPWLLSQLACGRGGARGGKLSTHSSTSSSSTDIEQHHRRMASSSTAPNLSQFVPLPLLTCRDCRLRLVWFKIKSNGIIYKCPNNHVVWFSSHALIHLISTNSVDIILVIISWLLVDIILVGFVNYYWFGWYHISRICWLLVIRLI